MQKENPVIKNYIMSSEKVILGDNLPQRATEISLYHIPLRQNKDCFFLFLSKR